MNKTKERIKFARELVRAEFPESSDSPVLIAAVIQSLAVDDLANSTTAVLNELGQTIAQSAAVAAGG
ncbi:MAG: hypothetical protein V4697_00975 [Patescibacteria group bacterium]